MRPSANMLTDTLVIVRPGTKNDRAGDAIPDWSSVTRTEVRGRLSQRSRSEDNAQRSAQIADWVAYFPAGTPIDGSCRVEAGGVVFEVVGPPYSPTLAGGAAHVETSLRSVAG